MAKRGEKKGKNFIKWLIIGLVILAILLVAYKLFFTGQVVIPNCDPVSKTVTINGGSVNLINGINVSLISSTSAGNIITASFIISGNAFTLTRDVSGDYTTDPHAHTTVLVGNKNYIIELVSATNTIATIKVTSSCFSSSTCNQIGRAHV
jgi:hypothetical protein